MFAAKYIIDHATDDVLKLPQANRPTCVKNGKVLYLGFSVPNEPLKKADALYRYCIWNDADGDVGFQFSKYLGHETTWLSLQSSNKIEELTEISQAELQIYIKYGVMINRVRDKDEMNFIDEYIETDLVYEHDVANNPQLFHDIINDFSLEVQDALTSPLKLINPNSKDQDEPDHEEMKKKIHHMALSNIPELKKFNIDIDDMDRWYWGGEHEPTLFIGVYEIFLEEHPFDSRFIVVTIDMEEGYPDCGWFTVPTLYELEHYLNHDIEEMGGSIDVSEKSGVISGINGPDSDSPSESDDYDDYWSGRSSYNLGGHPDFGESFDYLSPDKKTTGMVNIINKKSYATEYTDDDNEYYVFATNFVKG